MAGKKAKKTVKKVKKKVAAAKKAVSKKKAAVKKKVKKTVKKVKKKVAAAKKAVTKKKAAAKKKVKRTPSAAFMKAMNPSKDLAKVVGDKPLPRTEVAKKLWAYIKKNKLQDAANKRNIKADANLKKVFGGKEVVSMFEMIKLVNRHLS